MNNRDTDGSPIWGTRGGITNTADLFMYSLYCFTSDPTMTWDKLCLALLAHLYDANRRRAREGPAAQLRQLLRRVPRVQRPRAAGRVRQLAVLTGAATQPAS